MNETNKYSSIGLQQHLTLFVFETIIHTSSCQVKGRHDNMILPHHQQTYIHELTDASWLANTSFNSTVNFCLSSRFGRRIWTHCVTHLQKKPRVMIRTVSTVSTRINITRMGESILFLVSRPASSRLCVAYVIRTVNEALPLADQVYVLTRYAWRAKGNFLKGGELWQKLSNI